MAKSFTISMILKASNQMTAPVTAAANGLKALEQSVKRTSQSLDAMGKAWIEKGQQMQRNAAKSLAMVGVPLMGAGKLAADWEDSLAKISTMTTMTTAQVRAKWQKEFFAMSRETGADLADIGEAAYQALSAAVPEDQLVSFLKTAVMASKVGFTSTTMAVDGMTSAMNAFGISAENAGNLMMAAQIKGKTTIGDISQNIGQLGPIAANMGMSFQEVMAALAGMTQTGSRTEQAMTGIRSILMATAKQTDQQQEALKKLGIQFNVDTIKQYGFIKALQIVAKAARAQSKTDAEYAAILNDVFGRVEGLNAAFALTSGKGLAVYNDTIKMATTDTQLMVRAQEQMGDKTSSNFKKMKNEAKILSIELGTELMPALNAVMKGFAIFIRDAVAVVKSSKILQNTLIGLVAVFVVVKLGAFAAGTAIAFAGRMAKVAAFAMKALRIVLIGLRAVLVALGPVVSFLFSPVGILLVGIPLIIYGLTKMVKHWDTVKDAIKSAGSAVYEWFLAPIGRAFIVLGNWLKGIVKWFYNIGKQIATEIGEGIREGVNDAVDWVKDTLGFGGGSGRSQWWTEHVTNAINPQVSAVTPGVPQSFVVDMSGMTINAQDGTDFAKKAWGTLKPNLETQMKMAKQNQARTKMED